MSLLVVMGSGETAPTMVKVHREVVAASGPGPAVLLDTPFGFQNNADELVERTSAYFADSVGHPVEVARWRRADAPAAEHERTLALVARAAWAFAGPGSPTYALRQWRGTPLPDALLDLVRRGGTLVMGSAAACTMGTHAVPVYEIYKVGAEPHWVEGLDLLGRLTGVHTVVVPHYDNAEGGSHDTRFCYLGERRLAALEAQLPNGVGVLGVDEHTALVVDVAARTASVRGNGVVTARWRGRSSALAPGRTVGLDELAALLRGEDGSVAAAAPDATPAGDGGPDAAVAVAAREIPSLRAEAERASARFDAAVASRDVDGCVAAVLDLEQAIVDWSADTLQSDETDTARRTLRALVVRLGELAERGAADPREQLAPFVGLLLQLRDTARGAKDFATSDLVRDRLAEAGVEVRDTVAGSEWVLREDGR